jgi:hypothetical protein
LKVAKHDAWRIAFATQSASDLRVYQIFCKQPGLPVCHRLHYLQMHLEKLAKAFRWRLGLDYEQAQDLQSSHNWIEKVIPPLIREFWGRAGLRGGPGHTQLKRIREICREIDLLAPAVKAGGRRPDNSEYPWAAVRNGKPIVCIPCEEAFAV